MCPRNLVFMCLIGPKILFNLKNRIDYNHLVINDLLFSWNSETQNALINSDPLCFRKSLIINEFLFNWNSESPK